MLSVGGTTLHVDTNSAWSSEEVWPYAGGGASKYEGLPSYQIGLNLATRGTPDVVYDANPYTGFATFDSYARRGWVLFGGTSAATPQWSALIAIADQGRALAGKEPLANAQAALYSLPPTDFHDITFGSNRTPATVGYDLASGLGSPIANLVIQDLVAYNGSTDFTVAALPPTAKHGKSKAKSGKISSAAAAGADLAFSDAIDHPIAIASELPLGNTVFATRFANSWKSTAAPTERSARAIAALSPWEKPRSDQDSDAAQFTSNPSSADATAHTGLDAVFATFDATLLSSNRAMGGTP